MSTSNQTHDHKKIRKWAEDRGGVPSKVKGTEDGGGILRIHFPAHSESGNELEEIEWDQFFTELDKADLDFLYQDTKENGEKSTFHKFVERKS
ncbi:MAG TPA: hypothetical protein VGC08_15775 [Pedobacter sp.]